MKFINSKSLYLIIALSFFILIGHMPREHAGLFKVINANEVEVKNVHTNHTQLLDLEGFRFSNSDLKHLYKDKEYKDEYIVYELTFMEEGQNTVTGDLYLLPVKEGPKQGYLPPIRDNAYVVLLIKNRYACFKSDCYIIIDQKLLNQIMEI